MLWIFYLWIFKFLLYFLQRVSGLFAGGKADGTWSFGQNRSVCWSIVEKGKTIVRGIYFWPYP